MDEISALPMKILVEIHYQTLFTDVGCNPDMNFLIDCDLMDSQTFLLEMGYATIIRNNNQFCRHCTELTLVQFRCPKDGDQNYLKHCLIN